MKRGFIGSPPDITYVNPFWEDNYYIAPAVDRDKDQTFFLWGLKQDILQRMLLPMGDMTKEDARAYAAERGLCVLPPKRTV